MLFEDMMVDCVRRVPTAEPDEEGGRVTTWADGTSFRAAIVKRSDLAARIAEQHTDRREYTVTSTVALAFHDAFRAGDAKYRMISRGDDVPPARATFGFYQGTAEAWEEVT